MRNGASVFYGKLIVFNNLNYALMCEMLTLHVLQMNTIIWRVCLTLFIKTERRYSKDQLPD